MTSWTMKNILQLCKCGVFFSANEHKDYYESAESWLINQIQGQSDIDEIGKEVWDEMIKRDIVLRLQFYPDTPIGFYVVYHYDYDKLVERAKELLTEKG